MSNWNYRLLAHQEFNGVAFAIHEVYYDDNGNEVSYTENGVPVLSETSDGIIWVLDRMKEAADKPILWHGDDFPNEYKPK
jgi:hypothetical protein